MEYPKKLYLLNGSFLQSYTYQFDDFYTSDNTRFEHKWHFSYRNLIKMGATTKIPKVPKAQNKVWTSAEDRV